MYWSPTTAGYGKEKYIKSSHLKIIACSSIFSPLPQKYKAIGHKSALLSCIPAGNITKAASFKTKPKVLMLMKSRMLWGRGKYSPLEKQRMADTGGKRRN